MKQTRCPRAFAIPAERVEEAAKGLDGDDGVEQDPLVPREIQHRLQILIGNATAVASLVAVEEMDRLRHVDGEAESVDRRLDDPGDSPSHDLGAIGHGDADDLGRQAGEMLAHEQASLARTALRRDHDRVEARRPVVDLLGQLDRALEIAERADLIGPAFGNEVGTAAPGTHLGDNAVEDAGRTPAVRVDQIADLRPEHPTEEKVPVVALGALPLHRDHRAAPEARRHGRHRPARVGLQASHT